MKKSNFLLATIPLMLILLGFVSYQYGYVRIQGEITSVREEEAMKMKTLEKYIRLIDEKPVLEKRIAALKEARAGINDKLIEGETLSLAAAILQEMVGDIIVLKGGTISSERVGKPEDNGTFKVISISVDTVLPDAKALGEIIYAIETKTPHLVIKEVDARVRDQRNPRELTVKIDVAALTIAK